jgi:hypothetical protein
MKFYSIYAIYEVMYTTTGLIYKGNHLFPILRI